MPESAPRVHLLAGLNGAGKTTYARHLQTELPAVRFTQDEWILSLCPLPYDDPGLGAVTRSCRELIWGVALQVLANGTDVILDWNSWSRQQRREWSSKAAEHGYRAVVHYLRVPLETAIARAGQRTGSGTRRAYDLDAAAVRHLTTIFEEPAPDEGLELHVVSDWQRPAAHRPVRPDGRIGRAAGRPLSRPAGARHRPAARERQTRRSTATTRPRISASSPGIGA